MLEEIYNYLSLTDDIATAGQPTEAQLQDVARAGFEVVINLRPPGDDPFLSLEPTLVEYLGMDYYNIPVIWTNPAAADLQEFMDLMDANWGHRLFVHCAANMRVSAFMALYRVNRLGWSWETAAADMRRIWEPDPVWQQFIEDNLPGT